MTEMLKVTGYALQSFPLMYWAIALSVLCLAIWAPKLRWQKVAFAAAIVVAFGFVPAKTSIETYSQVQYRKAAWAHFEKRCKENAGEKIYKTAENVEGIFIIKPRPKATYDQLRDQFWMGDPYGYVPHELMIQSYLWYLNENGGSSSIETPRKGFAFVESPVDGQSGVLTRYSLDGQTKKLVAKQVANPTSPYGVIWEDVSRPEDRKYWIAGSKLQIIDLRTREVLAERIGYLLESGFGSTGQGGGRLPWEAARVTGQACPPISRVVDPSIDRIFVERVLKPSGENFHGK